MPTLLERTLPDPDFRERHSRHIAAPPEAVWAALSTLRLDQLTITRPLVALRGLAGSRHSPAKPLMEDGPVRVVHSEPPTYAVGGLIGRPWQPRPEKREVTSLEQLATFDEPGWTVCLTDFHAVPEAGGTRLSTETRGRSTDAVARRRFGRYWAVIRLGSGLIRRDMLATTDRLARAPEGAARA